MLEMLNPGDWNIRRLKITTYQFARRLKGDGLMWKHCLAHMNFSSAVNTTECVLLTAGAYQSFICERLYDATITTPVVALFALSIS